jgi:hypothetical protein
LQLVDASLRQVESAGGMGKCQVCENTGHALAPRKRKTRIEDVHIAHIDKNRLKIEVAD